MPKFHVERTIEVNAPAENTRRAIQNYGVWDIWSPWLCMEPTTKLEIEGTPAQPGHAYTWQGEMTGAGRMELSNSDGNTDNMDLTFIRPFKSTANVKFETRAIDNNNSSVTWHMNGSLPFFMLFMVDTMKAMIGMDYERGLKMLKEYVETNTVTSNSKIIGVVDVPEIHYTGATAECQLSDISDSMKTHFENVNESVQGKTTEQSCGAIYHDLNIKTQHCKYTAFATVNKSDAKASINHCRALKIVHTGSYQHLGNAWATANTCQRHRKLKKNKKIAPFELYVNDPIKVAQKDLITEIYLPVNA